MARVLALTSQDGSRSWIAECPACGCGHLFDSRWKLEGSVDEPSFFPSMLVHPDPKGGQKRCHSYLRNGFWEYLDDSQHAMRGQCVRVPET